MIPKSIASVLTEIIAALARRSELAWGFTGSVGMNLQGMDLAIHDVDIQSTASDAYEIEHLLLPVAESAVSVGYRKSERITSHFGEMRRGKIRIEIMGDVQHFVPEKGWTSPPDFDAIRLWVLWDNSRVPVISLEYERRAYYEIGRVERSQEIERYLSARTNLT
jgi:hypothetical protein